MKFFEVFFFIVEMFLWDVVRVNVEKGFFVFMGKVFGKRVRVYVFYLFGKGIKVFFGEDVFDYIF